ncbi:MAG: hypothetical protein KAV87_51200 [Desulfobacteraceae bacterium]|nr:hypothetical protein [Desulfobacteraceae bacterium]
MNNANLPQYDELEKLLAEARLPEPSPELKEQVIAEATRILKQASRPYRGGFLLGLCPPQQGPLGWLSGSPFAPVATACPIVGR